MEEEYGTVISLPAGEGLSIASEGIVIYQPPIDDFQIVPDEEADAEVELQTIIREFKIADVLSEIARYRIWRLRKNGRWKEIKNENGDQKFTFWEQLVNEISEALHFSRQQIFDRVRLYEQLYWLGYSAEESIQMVSDRPSLYSRVLGMVVDWDQRNDTARGVSIPAIYNVGEEKAKEHIRELLDDVLTFDTQKDALKYISESVLMQPQVEFWYNGDVFYVRYFDQFVDNNGALQVNEYGITTFYPDSEIPEWVKEEIIKKMRLVDGYHAEKKA